MIRFAQHANMLRSCAKPGRSLTRTSCLGGGGVGFGPALPGPRSLSVHYPLTNLFSRLRKATSPSRDGQTGAAAKDLAV